MWILTFVKILLFPQSFTLFFCLAKLHLPILQDPTHIPVDPFTNSSTLDLYLSLRQTGSVVTHLPMQEMWVQSSDLEDPLKMEMATYSSILAWRIQWTEEPGWATIHGVTEESDKT